MGMERYIKEKMIIEVKHALVFASVRTCIVDLTTNTVDPCGFALRELGRFQELAEAP